MKFIKMTETPDVGDIAIDVKTGKVVVYEGGWQEVGNEDLAFEGFKGTVDKFDLSPVEKFDMWQKYYEEYEARFAEIRGKIKKEQLRWLVEIPEGEGRREVDLESLGEKRRKIHRCLTDEVFKFE